MTTARSKKIAMYFAMSGLTVAWGLDYVAAKKCLDILDVPVLLFLRYCPALCAVLVVKVFRDRRFYLHKQDIPWLILSVLTGEIGYCFLEYSAIGYLPLPIITLILAGVPIVSIFIEKIFYGKPITRLMMLGAAASLLGVAIIIGADLRELFQGRFIGYLLIFGAVLCWNAYNFITARFHNRYSDTTLSFFQIACTLLLLAPYALRNLPDPGLMTGDIIAWLLFLGIFSAGIGYIIYVRSLDVLGVTPTVLFSNFMPVTTLFFSWAFFGEMILPVQIIGGIVVILAACLVIYEKGKQDGATPLRTTVARLIGREAGNNEYGGR